MLIGSKQGYLKTAEVAGQLQVTPETVTKWIAGCTLNGRRVRLRAVRAGRQWRVTQADLDAFLADCLSTCNQREGQG